MAKPPQEASAKGLEVSMVEVHGTGGTDRGPPGNRAAARRDKWWHACRMVVDGHSMVIAHGDPGSF